MFELKRLSLDAVPAALAKAEHYRLLNEPEEAESICVDILEVDPDNQRALIDLLLARTGQFEKGSPSLLKQAREVLPRLQGEYERAYYGGVICERQAKGLLGDVAAGRASSPMSGSSMPSSSTNWPLSPVLQMLETRRSVGTRA